ncbi:MAG: hypothetical protein IPN27_05825 [Cellvibrionales bacterium]|nr:hypothetical protein [Cellvibrionales bacterium]
MKKATLILAAATSLAWGSAALADANCGALKQDGNTWNLYCSADNSGSAELDYQCSYILSVTNADGQTDELTVQGSVGNGVEDAIIWSGIQNDGSDITAANIVSGSCTEQ